MKVAILITLILTTLVVKSQSTQLLGLFPTLDHSGKLSRKLEYGLYYFAAAPFVKISGNATASNSKLLLFYAENSVSYNLKKGFSLNAAYVYQKENPIHKNYVHENRIHFQIQNKILKENTEIKQRFRFDYRFLKPFDQPKRIISHRIRYLAGLTFPFKQNSKYYFTAYEEVFFNTKPITKEGVSENWLALMLGKKINTHHKLETGPLYITWKTGEQQWLHQYYWQFTWISWIDYSKRKLL